MNRVWKIVLICTVIWAAILLVLAFVWYKSIFKGHFTFFDDSREWLQMDKAGHFFCSFHVSRWLIQVLQWQKVDKKTAQQIGVWGGVLFVCPIELLDGFSAAYGFSWTDIQANCMGSFFLWIQLRYFSKMTWIPKFSFCSTPFAAIRKDMLGGYLLSQIIKDYNGQIIWLSVSPNLFLKRKVFPDWLLVSVGYGVGNVLGGHDNVWEEKEAELDFSHLTRYREVYFSLDVTLQAYEFTHPILKFTRLALSCLKFPFPAIGLSSEKGLNVNWLGV